MAYCFLEHLTKVETMYPGAKSGSTWHLSTDSIYRHTNTEMLKHLERDSEWLQMQLEQYNSISARYSTVFFYETCATPITAGPSSMVSGFYLLPHR